MSILVTNNFSYKGSLTITMNRYEAFESINNTDLTIFQIVINNGN